MRQPPQFPREGEDKEAPQSPREREDKEAPQEGDATSQISTEMFTIDARNDKYSFLADKK